MRSYLSLSVRIMAGGLLVVGLSACSRPAQTPPAVTQAPAGTSANVTHPPGPPAPPPADAPPAALVSIGESAEGLFDAADTSQWQTATEQLQALNEAALQLPLGLPKADLVGQLESRIEDVRQ